MGWSFILIVVLLLFAAWNTGTNLLYIVLGAVVSFVALSILLAVWNMRRLGLSREAPYAVHRGDPFLVSARIENRRRLVPAISVRIESEARPGAVSGYALKIPPQRAALLNVSECIECRGVHRLPDFFLATTFPFGLLERRRRFSDNSEIVVYPRISPIRTSVIENMGGLRNVARAPSSDGDEYFALREYIHGDDLRRVAWRASARLGVWMVREMSMENSRFVVLALDTRWNTEVDDFSTRFEEAVDLTASLAVSLLNRQYNVSVTTPAASLEGGEGSNQEQRILEMLARVQPEIVDDYPDFDQRLHKIEGQAVKLVMISPNPLQWGERAACGRLRTLDPREVTYA